VGQDHQGLDATGLPSLAHLNAVHLDTDGNLLISSCFTWTVYKVNRHTGTIIWELGGKQSTLKLTAAPEQVLDGAGEIFAYQSPG
jgi:Arylsulfotransferase (ASST)